jgi:hypothetical protein
MKDLYCGICGHKFESQRLLSSHIRHFHNLKYKTYYDTHIKKGSIGYCLLCEKPTTWREGKSYDKYCCLECSKKSPYKEFNRQKTNTQRFGTPHPQKLPKIKSKIAITAKAKNKNKSVLEKDKILEKRKQTNIKKYGHPHAMQSQICFHKCMTHQYTKKQYKLPSGRQVYLQGYEPQFLDFIFNSNLLKEEDIIYKVSGIQYKSFDNKQHKYYPDFYIPKHNLIIEIKSDYSLKCDKHFKYKKHACICNGYNYICVVNNNFEEFKNII